MKRERTKGFFAGVLTVILILSLGSSALAAVKKMTASLEYKNISVSLNGEKVALKDAKGNSVEPFILNGTNYLPVRALGEALGLTVAWDGATNTVVLTGGSSPALPAAPFTLSAGQYTVGEDIKAGKYDCQAISGAGNFHGTVAALGTMGLNEILGAPGSIYAQQPTYSNLKLSKGDTIIIGGDLQVEFSAK